MGNEEFCSGLFFFVFLTRWHLMVIKSGRWSFIYESSLFSPGIGFAFFAAINIHIDNKAKIMPEDNEVIKERTFPSTNISTGDNHLIAWDIASNPKTMPDVIKAVFCINISLVKVPFDLICFYRGSLKNCLNHSYFIKAIANSRSTQI